MTAASIPVDLFNPGQVFGCLGFVELAEELIGPVSSAFDWSDEASVRFVIDAPGDRDPFAEALRFLSEASVSALAPSSGDLDTGKWGVPTHRTEPREPFPVPVPASPASLPAILSDGAATVSLHSWGDVNTPDALGTRRDNVKFWAGAGGYPGVALLRDALVAVKSKLAEAREDPFAVATPQSSSFRFDWRRDYIPLDIGFSLNVHGKMTPEGYPLVEILAAIGLMHARPHRETKLKYRYGVLGRPSSDPGGLLPTALLRAALGCARLPFPTRTFTMHLGWPGQENQARCITTVHEETDR